MPAKKDIELAYRIAKIQSAKFSFEEVEEEELEQLLATPDQLKIDINVGVKVNIEKETIAIDVATHLTKAEDQSSLVKHTGRTVFEVKGLGETHDKEKDAYNLPDELVLQLYMISYTHARALLATELKSTVYNDKYFLPVIDPKVLLPKKESKAK